MLKKLTLGAGFAAGYVLGAKAGTQRYDQIVTKAREFAGMPAVQSATSTLQDTASTVADKAKDKANDTVAAVSAKVDDAKSSATGSSTTAPTTAPTTSPAPMAGAAPSRTAPDVV